MRGSAWVATTLIFSLVIGYGLLHAEQLNPLDTVKTRIDRIMEVLNDPTYHDPAKRDDQRGKIWEIALPMFDFREISRRTVGPDWDRFEENQKERFSKAFTEFLGNTYLDKIQGEYHNERIVYLKELVREPQALVRTQLVRENVALPIDYRMKLESGQWKIYDILVENGVSIVQNYRVQFQSILKKETPDQLIDRLETKIKDQNFKTVN